MVTEMLEILLSFIFKAVAIGFSITAQLGALEKLIPRQAIPFFFLVNVIGHSHLRRFRGTLQ